MVIFVLIFSKYIINIAYSPEYLLANETLKIFIFGSGFLMFFYIISSILNSIDREKLTVKISIFGLINWYLYLKDS